MGFQNQNKTKRLFLLAIPFGLFLAALGSTPAEKALKSPRPAYYQVPVLCYHHISRHQASGRYAIHPDEFRHQLTTIREAGIQVVSLRDLYRHMQSGRPFSAPSLVLTFDDGFASLKNYVAPILQEFAYKGTFFIYTKKIKTDRPDKRTPARYLSWRDLADFTRQGHLVQSHSISHGNLLSLARRRPGEKERRPLYRVYRELVRSYDDLYYGLEQFLRPGDHPVFAFAFPYGAYDDRLVRQALSAGYKTVASTDFRPVVIGMDSVVISRFTIDRKISFKKFQKIIATAQTSGKLSERQYVLR